MLSHYVIKLLNIVFVLSLGIITLRLFYQSLIFDKARRSSPLKRAELFLRVGKNRAPFLKMPLKKSHYLIGRGSECDIPLKGMGIPLRVGEIALINGEYVFKNLGDNSIKKILPGDEIMLYNYTIEMEGN
jgi:hypothetical protein